MNLSAYIGLPFVEHGRDASGLDCWGLVRLVLHEQFGADVPAYDAGYAKTTDLDDINGVVDRAKPWWRRVAERDVRPGYVALMRVAGRECHCGLVTRRGWMLHIEAPNKDGREAGAVQERYTRPRWKRRLAGFYRWQAAIS